MEFTEKAQLLSADSKPYDVSGNKGVSHKARFNIGGEIFLVRATEAQVSDLKQYIKETGTVVLKFTSPKENLRVDLVSFTV